MFNNNTADIGPSEPQTGRVADAALAYLRARKASETAAEAARIASDGLGKAEEALLLLFSSEGLSAVRVTPEGGSPTTVSSVCMQAYRVSQEALDKPVLRNWLEQNGGGSLLRYTVPWQSFEAFCRQLVDAGKLIPAEVNVSERKYVRVTTG